jgi:hypothetical protein
VYGELQRHIQVRGGKTESNGEEVDQVAQIPREVWRFCVEQIKLYPLTEIAYQNAALDIQACYDDAGYSGPPDQSGVVVHSGVAPQVSRYEAKQAALNNPHYRYLARCVAIMETAKRIEGGEILDAIWQVGWRDNVLIGLHANISTRSVARAKHELVRRIAAGWGLW